MKRIDLSDSVAVHIRRGDYVSNSRINKGVGVCGVEYYQRAIKFLAKRVKKPVFFIFSEPDGLEWAKSNLKIDYPYILVKSKKDYEDLRLMNSCRHNIIANSSFSWWGAWLNNNPKKIVVAPDPWFTGDDSKNDIVLNGWFKLSK